MRWEAGLRALGCAVAALASAGPAAAQQSPIAAPEAAVEHVVVLHCGSLLAQPGQPPLRKATLVVRDGVITDVLQGFRDWRRFEAPGREVRFIDLRDRFALPGLIDAHVHITGQMDAQSKLRQVTESDADAALRGALYARRTLEAGFTTVRDVGASGDAVFALRDAIARGDLPGPTILAAGAAITPTGGHGDDTHGFREDLFPMPGAAEGVADGPYEARKAVRHQVKRGADVVKITATGGVLSDTNAGTSQQFFPDELEAIVATAHALGRKVAAHAHGADGIKAALRAGVDSIEHGTFLDDEAVELFQRTGAFLVPTLLAGRTVTEIAQSERGYFPPAVRDKALAVGPAIQQAFARALAGGVRIAFGTDSGVSPHGQNAREFALMVEAGMTPMQAIVAATTAAAELLGVDDRVGVIAPGRQADVIAVDADPLQDVQALQRVVFVMKAGKVHKSP